jgi:uncharacterized repeat protein (TIGR04076 family)
MSDYEIKCEVISVNSIVTCHKVGDTFIIGNKTPAGMCCLAFAAIYPLMTGMRFSERITWERAGGYFDAACPDQHVVYRLTRIKK